MNAPPVLTARFYGTRGSIPAPGADTVRFGGNTACVAVEAGDTLLVLDAGTGLRALGEQLADAPPREVHLLLSHYHWDHLMGLPFFRPLYSGKTTVHLWAEAKNGRGVAELAGAQMAPPFFPIPLFRDRERLVPHTVAAGDRLTIGGVAISTCRLPHPDGCLAWRLDYEGRSLVYATDAELDTVDPALVAFTRNAGVLVVDATYTPEEYPAHRGWGHSTWEMALDLAEAAGVARVALFHHLPGHSDLALEALEAEARRRHPGALAAREGQTLHL